MIPYNPIGVLFYVGTYPVYAEMFAMIVGFIIYFLLVIRHLKKESIITRATDIYDLVLVLIISSLLGGRIWYFVAKGVSFWDFFLLNEGGTTSFGMILGALVGVMVYMLIKWRKIKGQKFDRHAAKILDVIALYAGLWIFIYRIFGCTLTGDVVGTETSLPWAFVWQDGIARHPTSVYLGLGGLVVFIFLNYYKKRARFVGEIGLLFVLLYSLIRLFIEFFREPAFPISFSQIFLLIVTAYIVVVLIYKYSFEKR